MKIVVDGREFVRGRATGIGRFLGDALCALAAQKTDWDFVLLLNQRSEFLPEFPNLRKLRFMEVFTPFSDQVQIPLLLRREKADVFLSPYYKIPLLSGVPAVVTICDLINLVYPGYARSSVFYRYLFGLYASKASAILTISGNSRKDINRLLGVPDKDIFVAYPAVDPGIFHRMVDEATRAKYGLEKPYILYVGNGNRHKNLDGLIAAYAALPEELLKKHELVFVGPAGYPVPALRAPARCRVLPFLRESELAQVYSGAEIFVFPSFYEGFGLPPLEAMACGCPVASSDTSCMPEVLGDAAVYFHPDRPEEMTAAMQKLLIDPGLREKVRVAGSLRAKLYFPERTCSGILAALEAARIKVEVDVAHRESPGGRGKVF